MELSQQIILGLDFLARHQVSLDCATKSVIFPAVQEVTVLNSVHVTLSVEFPTLLEFHCGSAKVQPVVIKMGNVQPIRQPIRRRAMLENEVITKEVNEMLKLGVVRPSHSPWCSPVHLVRKKDGTSGVVPEI